MGKILGFGQNRSWFSTLESARNGDTKFGRPLSAVPSAIFEILWLSFPLFIWWFWLKLTGDVSDLYKKPEISFIAVIFSLEAVRTTYKNRSISSHTDNHIFILTVFAVVFSVVFLGLDIGQYEKTFTEDLQVSNILFFKFIMLTVSALSLFLVHVYYRNTFEKKHYNEVHEEKQYNTDSSPDFYSAIAAEYDLRNSTSLRQLHLEIVRRIRIERDKCPKEKFRVLDLGGGSGRIIAEHFFSDSKMEWVNLDASSEMIANFNSNFSGSKMRVEAHKCNILIEKSFRKILSNQKFDIILLSYTLSSMAKNPNWAVVTDFLTKGGVLLIGEADASYLVRKPDFDVQSGSTVHKLKLRVQEGTQLKNELVGLGLKVDSDGISKHNVISGQDENYGYVMRATWAS